MSKVIATIKLAPGKVAFYDEYSHIHLTIANPIAYIYENTPLKRIKASIRSGTLRVINGSLVSKPDEKKPLVAVPSTHKKRPEVIDEPVIATKPVEEPVVAEPVITEVPADEVIAEEATAEPVAEKAVKKGRKKTTEAVGTVIDETAPEIAE